MISTNAQVDRILAERTISRVVPTIGRVSLIPTAGRVVSIRCHRWPTDLLVVSKQRVSITASVTVEIVAGVKEVWTNSVLIEICIGQASKTAGERGIEWLVV